MARLRVGGYQLILPPIYSYMNFNYQPKQALSYPIGNHKNLAKMEMI